jgi:hypothetical protein
MLQLPGDPRLTDEALCGRRVGRVTLGEQLDGHVEIEGDIAGAVDNPHAALADFVDQFVARWADGRDARLGGGSPMRPSSLCQVFGHGTPFPRSPEVACGRSKQIRLSVRKKKQTCCLTET